MEASQTYLAARGLARVKEIHDALRKQCIFAGRGLVVNDLNIKES